MRVAVVQLTSTDDLAANLRAAERAGARGRGGRRAFHRAARDVRLTCAARAATFPHAQAVDGEIVGHVRGWARELGVRILAGSIAERAPGESRVYNTSALISPGGEIEAVYRKIHLFDVDLGDEGGGRFRESARVAPGKEVVVAETSHGGIGLSVCYDLRFPELYRAHGRARRALPVRAERLHPAHGQGPLGGAAARPRDREPRASCVAPAQCGRHGPERASHGRSLIVDPWGVVLAQLGDRPGVAIADCDLEEQERMRRRLPALDHRRL